MPTRQIQIPVTYETEVVSKKGSTYDCLVIHLPNGLKKMVFLNPAEKVLLEMSIAQQNAQK